MTHAPGNTPARSRAKRPKSLRKEVFLPHPPERVWVALTDPHALAEWLMPNTFRAELGHRFEFRYDKQPLCGSGVTSCTVLELDPPRRMVWSWLNEDAKRPGRQPMRVEWTLVPEANGTRLILVHSGLEHERWIIGVLMRMGWGEMVGKIIPKVLANVSSSPPYTFTPGAIPLAKRCYRANTIPPEFVR